MGKYIVGLGTRLELGVHRKSLLCTLNARIDVSEVICVVLQTLGQQESSSMSHEGHDHGGHMTDMPAHTTSMPGHMHHSTMMTTGPGGGHQNHQSPNSGVSCDNITVVKV